MTITINGTTGIAGVDGSASVPAFKGNDADTGIYYPTANTVAAAAGGSSVWNASSTFGFKNRIINGDMRIDQRNNGAAVTGGLAVDRFSTFLTYVSNLTYQRNAGSVTPPPGFTNYLGITTGTGRTVGASDLGIWFQAIEGFNISDLGWGTANAQTVTLSFWVRSSLTGTHSGSLLNDGDSRGYVFQFPISAANTWEYKTITIPGDTSGTWLTNNGKGIVVSFNVGSGSTLLTTAGSWTSPARYGATGSVQLCATTGATFYITGVQLEAGPVATSFDYRPIGQELLLCQRYFAKTFPQTTAVAQNTNESGALDCPINPTAGTAGLLWTQWVYPVIMRASPTITTFNPSAANSNWRNSAGTLDLTASTGQQSDRVVQVRAANVPSGQGAYIHLTASAEL